MITAIQILMGATIFTIIGYQIAVSSQKTDDEEFAQGFIKYIEYLEGEIVKLRKKIREEK